jgi:DNA-binding response OmpR family regulator
MAKIMIVDDDVQAAGLVERVVKMYGHQAVAVNRSSLAVETANSFLPDLFILDLMMPEINGFELCTLLREDPKFTATPVIVVSAMEDKESRIKAFSAGVNEYLTKPFNIMELGEKIRILLANGKSGTGE